MWRALTLLIAGISLALWAQARQLQPSSDGPLFSKAFIQKAVLQIDDGDHDLGRQYKATVKLINIGHKPFNLTDIFIMDPSINIPTLSDPEELQTLKNQTMLLRYSQVNQDSLPTFCII